MAGACREVVESVLLFVQLQNAHMSRSTLKQLNPTVSITWSQIQSAGGDSTGHRSEEPQALSFRVQVLASGLGAYYVDGTLFLNKLCDGDTLRRLLQSSASGPHYREEEEECLLQLTTRRIGDSDHMSCFILEGFSSVNDKQQVIEESVERRPDHLHPTSLLLTYKMSFTRLEILTSEANRLLVQLHLMHLINPEVTMKLMVEGVRREELFSVGFETEPYRALTKTSFKLVPSLQHFMDHNMIPARQSKLHLLKGDTYNIPGNESSPSFRVFSAASVVPHLVLRNGKRIPANRLCKRLHIFVFGPFNTPLLLAGIQANFPLSSLAEWDSYGLSVRQQQQVRGPEGGGEQEPGSGVSSSVTPSIICELTNTRPNRAAATTMASTTRPPQSHPSSSVPANHLLMVFIFLEEASKKEKSLTGDSSQWKHRMELLHHLRVGFQNVVVAHSRKFQQSVHSVLNKLICNYGSHAKTSSVMSTAIPLISDAVSSIIRNSSNEEFKRTCKELTGAEDEGDIKTYVDQKLWKIARERLRVTESSMPPSHNPDEPTSPEIIMATNDSSSTNPSRQKRETSSSSAVRIDEIERPPLETTTETHASAATSEEPTDCTLHTLSTTSVLQARLLSKATQGERERKESDCFEALELVGEHMDTETQQKMCNREESNGPSHPSDLTSTLDREHDSSSSPSHAKGDRDCFEALELVCEHMETEAQQRGCDSRESSPHPSVESLHKEVDQEQSPSPTQEKDSINLKGSCDGGLKEIEPKNASEDEIFDYSSMQDSPSLLLNQHPIPDIPVTTSDGTSFDDLEHFSDEGLTMTPVPLSDLVDDTNPLHMATTVSSDVQATNSFIDSTLECNPDHSNDTQTAMNSSFDELECFDDSSSTFAENLTSHERISTSNNTAVASTYYSDGFDDLECFSDDGSSTCMELTEDDDTIVPLYHETQSVCGTPSGNKEQEAYNKLECDRECTLTFDATDEHPAVVPTSDGEQCIPLEEADTYTCTTSDEEWEKVAGSDPTATMIDSTQSQTHHYYTTIPTHQETIGGFTNSNILCAGDGDPFDQLEFCSDQESALPTTGVTTHAVNTNQRRL